MTALISLAGCVGLAALIYVVVILLQLSRKLGEVTRMRPYYRGYYAAVACFALALAVRLVVVSVALSPAGSMPAWLSDPWFYLLGHHLALAAGATIAVPITWKYWSWLLRE